MHKEYLLSALEQAKLGRGRCAPNPSVGAVAVQHGQIIAEAWHPGAGLPHAEQILLTRMPPSCQDVTLYVTLEPCNHWGRTPPCVDAIIAHKIKRVVYAYADPNPLVSANDSPKILGEHGIEVIHYPLPEIDRFYQSYHHWLHNHKPWVTVKIAQTLDGHIAGAHGIRSFISNSLCADFTHQKRKDSDVILTTSHTILQDNPQLTARLPGQEVVNKPLAVLDRSLRLQHPVQALQMAKQGIIYYDDAYSLDYQHADCAYYPMPVQDGHLDLSAVLGHLGSLGYHDLWVEAGSVLFTALHQAGLVNRTHIYIAPKLLGKTGLPLYANMDAFTSAQTVSWQIMDDNVMLTIDW
ncbi:MAG: bifunctional diaminohydroxyphosphoribosylaminopyrimidine deaminase/5-amino-6-(5-phosphoribosylamino)uracil reductase RibD [Legionellales bacterium]|nr:bifunctional diaminohydroxyphosphoribosylaminopyrimidine deaminase/5-amino-6-(5-phosphoribosylamino)uracil reductase RibD [Legionellales bacterium]